MRCNVRMATEKRSSSRLTAPRGPKRRRSRQHGSLGEPYYQEKLSEQMAHARAALDRARELVSEEGVDAEEEILEGSAADRVVELARARDAPLIVVGSRGLGAVAGALLGSVSSAIIHRTDRPVLVVPRPSTATDSR